MYMDDQGRASGCLFGVAGGGLIARADASGERRNNFSINTPEP